MQTLAGPNRHSQQHFPLIQARVDLQMDAHVDWKAKLAELDLIPGDTDTPADVLLQLVCFLQKRLGVHVRFAQHTPTGEKGISLIVFHDDIPDSGKQILQLAMEWMQLMAEQQSLLFDDSIRVLEQNRVSMQPDDDRKRWLDWAKAEQIPLSGSDGSDKLCFGYGKYRRCYYVNESPDQFNHISPWRIPLIAVTGSNGKTTTTRLIAFMATKAGFVTGYTTSDGIYIGNEMVDEGDTTGPVSARRVLEDPAVEFAVLESARGGIVRAGLAFSESDIAVITNVQEDHLGISDIHSIEDLARVKEVVAATARKDGFAVLNAGNVYTRSMAERLTVNIAWFCAADPPSWLKQHAIDGGAAAWVEAGEVVLYREGKRTALASLAEIPLTFNGTVGFMVENVLAAALAAGCSAHIPDEAIRAGLTSFTPSEKMTPGRMNQYTLAGGISLLVDFAHNPDGFAGIADYLKHVNAERKIGIIVGTGDRKDEDIIALGRISAAMFDHIFIHQVKFLRGRTSEEITGLLVQGINSRDPNKRWERIPDASDPFQYVMLQAKSGDHITALSNVLNDVPNQVAQWNTAGFRGETL
jgi:UDP-N-acetylmuramyl tripeptide synthase